ncbi:hypothetical protein [Paenibacillus sp. UMB4589-SE434]|uniref:hypothetical protein n=1 Tax=Paenibacillus sp. UMB4589-SE434 TaxID=3046314 RepID=UPI002550D910|nr:hypothetical protein [Paenibacillus sp. UMB4589-SE434]MDK8181808.1 hypothetical protein [Paenibacillus sp. UMB4589-SE434]
MEISFKPSYGVIKHSMATETVAELVSLLIEEDSMLLFSFYERNMHLFDESIQKFILDRCVFVNSEWILPWSESIAHWDEPNRTPPNIIWFWATQIEDIIKAIEIDNLFRCIVVKRGEEFKDYSNVLFHQEYYSCVDEEDYEYYLGFTNKEVFFTNSLHDIKMKFEVRLID